MSPIIFCDMDGVLCDFYGAANKLSPNGIDNLSVPELWSYTRNQTRFWYDLEWMPGGQAIWALTDKYKGHILSSLPYSDSNSKPGKLYWLRKNINLTDRDRIHLTTSRHHKKRFAVSQGTSNILIDDYHKNITEWNDAGGIGILHTDSAKTLDQLAAAGFEL
ncbi:MAG: hypothetical protein OXI60_00350 [Acidiferrobacterales bacterium]|nr:hypothetical protein [Acidiferrobacterales bacterium]